MQAVIQIFKKQNFFRQLLFIGWLIILLLLPFHAFLSTWGGTAIGPLEVWKTWKELLLGLLVIPTVLLVVREKELRSYLLSSNLVRIIGLYILLHILAVIFMPGDLGASLLGLAINLRLVLFLLISFVTFWGSGFDQKFLLKILAIPCLVVVVFGILQMFILPTNFLNQFGYEQGVTIDPMINIDEQPDQIRIMSTLRGPNPLGAYLLLPGTVAFILIVKNFTWLKKRLAVRSKTQLLTSIIALMLLIVALYGSHGRAAWIGFAVSIGICLLAVLPQKIKIFVGIAGILVASLAGVGIYTYRHTPFVQTVILHDNPQTGAELTSNDAHIAAARQGLEDIAERPLLGCGLGCAGPASFYNEQSGINLAENYFIQIGQQVGVGGVVLFLLICMLIGKELWQRRKSSLGLALFASLIGISVANVLLHVWADDTLAYVWWGLAGALLTTGSHQGSAAATAKHPRTSD